MAELQRVIVGQERLLERVLVGLLAGGHCLLEGVPGLGKTLTVSTLARTLGGTTPLDVIIDAPSEPAAEEADYSEEYSADDTFVDDLFMGAAVDAEIDAFASAAADGDDNNTDDNDGCDANCQLENPTCVPDWAYLFCNSGDSWSTSAGGTMTVAISPGGR